MLAQKVDTGVHETPHTQEEFEQLLDKLRPHPKDIQVIYHYGDNPDQEYGATIYTDGQVRHVFEVLERPDFKAFQNKVEKQVDFYRNPTRLWPGCRGQVARYLGEDIRDSSFHKWFDCFTDGVK